MSSGSSRSRRSDAALNSERLVRSAREVFAERGLSATLEEIAAHAGVGVGTIYRNFASKRAIVETLYDAAIESALADVQSTLDIDDPWDAIVAFFEITARTQARDRGLSQTLLGSSEFGPSEPVVARLVSVLSPLFERATRAGVLREGVSVTDVGPIIAMLEGVYRISDADPELWRRYLTLLLDGLRATDRGPIAHPALDVAAFGSIFTTGR